jgi:hypothetical protein
MSDAVSSAMRTLSLEPLIDGVPAHCATDGILPALRSYSNWLKCQGWVLRYEVACAVIRGMECCIGR